MIRRSLVTAVCCVALGAVAAAQTKAVPRPPAQPAGQQPPGESAAPDGYQPVPQWLGQTRAAVPAKVETFAVETFAQGVNGAAFQFLPDGRILLAEKNGRLRIVGKDGKLAEPLTGMPSDMFTAGQSVFSAQPEIRVASSPAVAGTAIAWRRRRTLKGGRRVIGSSFSGVWG